MLSEEQKKYIRFLKDKLITSKNYVNTFNGNKNVTSRGEKIINTYKNASYEPVSKQCALSIN